MSHPTERFFIPAPTPTTKTKTVGNATFPVYMNEKREPLMWSGEFPLPAIGSRVFIKMNRIGWALVKGYFESDGYLGVMTLPLDPPAWLREQNEAENDPTLPDWMHEGVGCEYGSELSLEESELASPASRKRK